MSEINEMIDEALEIESAEAAEMALIKSRREALESNITNVWGHSSLGLEAKKAAMTMLSTKHGMYAKIPLVCKAQSCPYSDSCLILKYDLAPEGEPCAVETAEIEARYAGYSADFDIEVASFTDRALVSEIINLDIMIERTKALMSKEGVPIVDVVAGVDEDGNVLMRPEVSKAVEAYEKFTKKRNEIYQLMLATRKDKKIDTTEDIGLNAIIAQAIDADENGGFVIDERPDKFKGE